MGWYRWDDGMMGSGLLVDAVLLFRHGGINGGIMYVCIVLWILDDALIMGIFFSPSSYIHVVSICFSILGIAFRGVVGAFVHDMLAKGR